MFKWLSLSSVLALLLLAGGCATSPTVADASSNDAVCHVCRYNNDLACVCVHVKDSTPHLDYNGQTYYFCSEDCRAEFAKRPAKYLPKADAGAHHASRAGNVSN